ncbi:MAG: uroporphyrinogen-III C-methyltransferase, partial [Gammaproteobacteria bacterium]|nr:uroporphyrinogen-III C-methyltransferase [Gammaproteobacteria bacterium]
PLKVPEYLLTTAEGSATAQEVGFFAGLSDQLAGYLRFRRLEGGQKPLLAPEEAVYLELNLRLMLERAQLAALRRQQVVYEQSLATARDWIVEFLAADEDYAQRIVMELQGLLEVELNLTLPDISGSLTALEAARRGPE